MLEQEKVIQTVIIDTRVHAQYQLALIRLSLTASYLSLFLFPSPSPPPPPTQLEACRRRCLIYPVSEAAQGHRYTETQCQMMCNISVRLDLRTRACTVNHMIQAGVLCQSYTFGNLLINIINSLLYELCLITFDACTCILILSIYIYTYIGLS